ncbi:MAG: 3-deoxy-manno-octulosonate cytidylyltransferase [Polynucleobacter sp.]|nr:MAG: 3-deoxy-manno-octulosonate cytidylyltransferase [Polynucleobacter sp.]
MSNSFIAVIPARLASTRLPNKPLADIAGKPMVVRVAERALLSGASRVVVAVDDQSIFDACQAHGLDVMLTSNQHPTGTDRLSEVASRLQLSDDTIVVNVQGDEPLIPAELITQVAETLAQHPSADIATAALAIEDLAEVNNPNVVKVAMSQSGQALYFSRAPIPFSRDPQKYHAKCFRHIGMYAYKAGFLKEFSKLAPAPIEEAESLEQLRAMWYGYTIQVLITDAAPPPGVDTAEDLERVRQVFKNPA